MILSFLMLRYKKYLIVAAVLLVAFIWLKFWISNQQKIAVHNYKVSVQESTSKQVKQDEEIAKKTYSTVTDGMRARADIRMQQRQASSGDRLQRFSGSKRATTRAKGNKHLGGSDVLSNKEVAQVLKHADLLQ